MDFKEKLFLLLSGIFLTSLVLANIIGTTKFVIVFGLTVPAGPCGPCLEILQHKIPGQVC